ncbi:MAG: glycosyltransferase family 2 protein [Propionibacteriaceae bacterium]|nr:glycosyltransferase family 2 protein [Propionibacteriaceae bacterium]
MAAAHPLLTVVVNFFRLGPLAEDALASLRWSADPRIRFLLVDDASPDDTPERLHRAAASLPGAEVLVLPQNHGLAGARMAALNHLDTEWFTFLDGDDWVAKGYYPALLDEVLELGVDWVRTDHIQCTGRQRLLVRIPDVNRAGRIGSPRESILSARTSSVDFAHAWSGVYHRRLAESGAVFYPPELRTAEDRPSIWRLHLSVPEFTIARTVGVHYRQAVEGSLTQTGDVRQLAVTESMRQVGEIVAADPEADRFRPKVLRTWAGLFAWHWQHKARFTPALRARFITEAAGLLDTADPDELNEVIRAMPESRRQAVEALRRSARVLGRLPQAALAGGGR